jgi:hypothetical protein
MVYGVAAAWCAVFATFYLYPDGSCFHSSEAALLFLLLLFMQILALFISCCCCSSGDGDGQEQLISNGGRFKPALKR